VRGADPLDLLRRGQHAGDALQAVAQTDFAHGYGIGHGLHGKSLTLGNPWAILNEIVEAWTVTSEIAARALACAREFGCRCVSLSRTLFWSNMPAEGHAMISNPASISSAGTSCSSSSGTFPHPAGA